MKYTIQYRDMSDARHYLAIYSSRKQALLALEGMSEGVCDIAPDEEIAIDYKAPPLRHPVTGESFTSCNMVGSRIKTGTDLRDYIVDYDIIPDVY